LVLGITFKENCPDVRNTKVVDVISTLKEYAVKITVSDPWAREEEVQQVYGITTQKKLPNKRFDAVLLAVSHTEFQKIDLTTLLKEKSVIYDVKNVLPDTLKDKGL